MQFGMSTACFFPNVYNEDAIDVMGKMGVSRCEIFFSCMAEYQQNYVKELKRRADHWGIEVSSVHAFSLQFEPMLFSAHDRARQEALDIYKQVLDAASMLNAQSYVFHGPANVKRARKLVLNYDYIAERTQPLTELSQQQGIKLSWENVHWCWYSSPDFPQKLLPLLSPESLWFTFDLKQALQSGYEPADFLLQTQGTLSNVHICDVQFDEQLGCVPVLPLLGCVNFDELVSSLNQISYSGPVIYEVYSHNYKNHDDLLNNYLQTKEVFCY